MKKRRRKKVRAGGRDELRMGEETEWDLASEASPPNFYYALFCTNSPQFPNVVDVYITARETKQY